MQGAREAPAGVSHAGGCPLCDAEIGGTCRPQQRFEQRLVCCHKGCWVTVQQPRRSMQQAQLKLLQLPLLLLRCHGLGVACRSGGGRRRCRCRARRLGTPEALLRKCEHLLLCKGGCLEALPQQGQHLLPPCCGQRQQQPAAGCPLGHLCCIQQAGSTAVPRKPHGIAPLRWHAARLCCDGTCAAHAAMPLQAAHAAVPVQGAAALLLQQLQLALPLLGGRGGAWSPAGQRGPPRRRSCRWSSWQLRGGGSLQERKQFFRELPAALLHLACAVPPSWPAKTRKAGAGQGRQAVLKGGRQERRSRLVRT